ncbi:MAG: TorF family putative porin [Pseudomonadales bacterium]|nr:TorF family putative porin [Pseudomonadales bacterium]
MKSIIKLLPAALLWASTIVSAEGTESVNGFSLSGNVSLASDYLYRGLSQTTGDPALQGGLDLNHESGLYAGVWGSNVDFADSLELDYYGGYSAQINEDLSYDVGVLYYDYPSDPSDPKGDFLEYYGSISWKSLTVGLNYSNDFFAETGDAIYYYGSYDFELPMGIGISLYLAQQEFDQATFGNDDSYTHYSLSFSKEVLGVELGLSWSDTDISKSDCAGAGFSRNDCDSTVVFSITKSM